MTQTSALAEGTTQLAEITIQSTIEWLQQLGLPPLPVAPLQDPYEYPKVIKSKGGDHCPLNAELQPEALFTGKNPSYLDKQGKPHLIPHRQYQEKLPTPSELKKWFANSENGIGTLGGHGGYVWIDFDVKCFQPDDEHGLDALQVCEVVVEGWIEEHDLYNTVIERTHSGGYRVGVKVPENPGFTNFCMEEGGPHLGEALGEGRFTVLAPSVGPSGYSYLSVSRRNPIEVESLEEIGILPISKPINREPSTPAPRPAVVSSGLELELLFCPEAQEILRGYTSRGDLSEALTVFISESYGWENWCAENGLSYTGDTQSLAQEAGAALGLDSERITRILERKESTVSPQPHDCKPAAWLKGGGDDSCWLKVKKFNRLIYEEHCPEVVRDSIANNHVNGNGLALKPAAVRIPGNDLDDGEGGRGGTSQYEIAFDALYKDHWICVDEKLYQWQGNHYAQVHDATEKRRIARWAKAHSKTEVKARKDGTFDISTTKPFASPEKVNGILAWAKINTGRDPAEINQGGINTLGGVIQIQWEGSYPTGWTLTPHDPKKHLFTYCAEWYPNRDADPAYCNQLLECLDPEYRTIFLKLSGASLDLETVRRFKGRITRACLLKGDGNNGKDSLRIALTVLYGSKGMTGATLSDFQSYDTGRKFPLMKLEYARVSWASETTSFGRLDGIQCLKAAITGDPLDREGKNENERQFVPNIVFFFNINDTPNLQASQEAIKSRYAILPFTKVFKSNPDPALGELPAISGFKYDQNFVSTKVVPAFFNQVFAALQSLMAEGIDYSATLAVLEEVQCNSNHLFQFAKDVGLVEHPAGKVPVKELWDSLREWYLSNGVLEVETNEKGKEVEIWSDFSKWDLAVRHKTLLSKRLSSVFPKIKPGRSEKMRFLAGIQFPKTDMENPSDLSACQESPDFPVNGEAFSDLEGSSGGRHAMTTPRQELSGSSGADDWNDDPLTGHDDQMTTPLTGPNPHGYGKNDSMTTSEGGDPPFREIGSKEESRSVAVEAGALMVGGRLMLTSQAEALSVGDVVQILTGQFADRQAKVVGVLPSGELQVQAKSWAITRNYHPNELALVSKGKPAEPELAIGSMCRLDIAKAEPGELPKGLLDSDLFEVMGAKGYRVSVSLNGNGEPFEVHRSLVILEPQTVEG